MTNSKAQMATPEDTARDIMLALAGGARMILENPNPAIGSSCISNAAAIAAWNSRTTIDSRPCHTDLFLVHIMEHESDHYDRAARIKDWLEGDWDAALEDLPTMEDE